MDPSRLGLSAARLQGEGMWGEPARAVALATLTRGVELGIRLVLVPAPFGPAADLVREALHPYPADLCLAVRLTSPAGAPDVILDRLAVRRLALTIAPPNLATTAAKWEADGVTGGVAIMGAGAGPWPPPGRPPDGDDPYYVLTTADWPTAADARPGNVLLPAATSPKEIEKLVEQLDPTTPRGGGPR